MFAWLLTLFEFLTYAGDGEVDVDEFFNVMMKTSYGDY